MSISRKYQRQGLVALYAFTPFKIIYTSSSTQSAGDSTVITFWYPSNATGYYCEKADTQFLSKSIQEVVNQCKKLNELWRVPLREKVYDQIHIYRVFPAIEFSPQCRKYVLIIDCDLLDYFIGKKPEDKARESIKSANKNHTFVLAEYSYESINRPSFCRYGLVLITHRQTCPLISVCPLMGLHTSSSCPYFITWSSAKENYAGLYKVVADIKIRLREFESQQFKVVKTLVIVPYRGKPLFEVVFVDPVNILAYYDAINFLPKKYIDVMLRAKLSKTLGIRLYMTSALKISFNDKVLEELINDLRKDLLVWSWLEFKAGLLALAQGIPGEAKKNPYIPWSKLEQILCGQLSTENRKKILHSIFSGNITEMQRAIRFIVIHTIAHMILMNLWSTLGLSSDELSYVIVPRNDSFNVWIFEATSGGYGYLRHLAEHREALYSIISDALQSSVDSRHCVVSVDKNTLSMLYSLVSSTINGLKLALPQQAVQLDSVHIRLQTLIDNISMLYNSYNITPHDYTVYRCLANIIPGELKEHFNKVIDKFLEVFNLFDGTIGKHYIEEGCISGPFLQPFSVSCSISKTLAVGISQQSIELPLKGSVLKWIKTAKSSIDIMTWVLSVYDFDELVKALKKACENNAKIRILLGKGIFSDENALNIAVKSLERLFQDLGKCLEARLYEKEQLHAKMILIDGITLIQGSFNLTKAALTSNKESALIIMKPEEVKKISEEFNKLWNEAKPITKPNDLTQH